MAKFTSAEVSVLAEQLKRGKNSPNSAHFLIGAGCSVTAGIPSATDLIKQIHEQYPTLCARLSDDKRYSYGSCMHLLSIEQRRDLIRPYLAAAKVNWGTIALAQLVVEGFVERVLTVNFDRVVENACALLGSQPAIYDFGVAPANERSITMIVSPAIVHLHGQSYGFKLLNTENETQKHRKKLKPILEDSLVNAPLVVIGYSGSADGISRTLLENFKGDWPLYWIGHSEEPGKHLEGFLKKDYFHFLGGADFDRFMIELAQSLGCWPPRLFTDPFGQLLEELNPVVAYPVGDSGGSVDFLESIKGKLELLRRKMIEEDSHSDSLREPYMKGDFEGAAKLYAARPNKTAVSDEDRQIVYWSYIGLGNLLLEQAQRAGGDEAAQLFALGGEKYAAAVSIKPDDHEALYKDERHLPRTAKSCGPDAPTLASSSFTGMTVAKEPGHRGDHDISRKAIAQGRPDALR